MYFVLPWIRCSGVSLSVGYGANAPFRKRLRELLECSVCSSRSCRISPDLLCSRCPYSAQAGGNVGTEKKYGAGGNKSGAAVNAAKIEQEDSNFVVETVGFEFKIALMKARQAKGLKQAELAEKLSVKPSVINDYESGRAVPDGGFISKLNRALGVTLPKPPKKKAAADE